VWLAWLTCAARQAAASSLIHGHLLYFMDIWYIFPHFWYIASKKSGNPGTHIRQLFEVGDNVARKVKRLFFIHSIHQFHLIISEAIN
jgi:hypothetical protein